MKHLSLIIGIICIIPTVCIGLLFDGISTNSTIIASLVICFTSILVYVSSVISQRKAFKISLPFYFVFNGIVEYILAYFIDDTVKNNAFFAIIISLLTIQICTLVITYIISKFNDGK